ncbi:MAG: dehydrogenase [Frankiales bacterium]|nr:MAG: dehydrogenase [Frankiales bacterium]
MQAARLVGPGTVVVEDVERPAVMGPGQVLVQNLVSTICGSDVHVVYGATVEAGSRPGYPGHESVGLVVESSAPEHRPGDLLLAVPNLAHAGGFAEYQLLPAGLVLPLPADAAPETAVLAQQLGTTIFAMKRFWPGAGEGTAVVLGAGAVGLFFTRLCRLAGFEQVVVADLHPHRLELALAVGATRTVLADGDAVVDVVQQVEPAGARLVVEAAGTDVTRRQAIHCVAVDGRIGMFGMPAGPEMTIPFELLFRRKPTVEFCWDAQAEPGHASFREGWDAIRTGRVDPAPFLPRLWPLADLPTALEAARTAEPGSVKYGVRLG